MNSPQSPVFQRARVSDSDLIQTLAHKIWHSCYAEIISQSQIDYMLGERFSPDCLRDDLQGEHLIYWLVTLDHEAVGYGVMGAEPVIARSKIHQIYLLPEVAGRGLGSAFMSHMSDEAGRAGAQAVWLTVNKRNTGALKFYEQRGFTMLGSYVAEIGEGFVMDDYLLERSLASL